MGGSCPESGIKDPTNTKMEETSWGQRRIEAAFEGAQGPEGAVAPYMDEHTYLPLTVYIHNP